MRAVQPCEATAESFRKEDDVAVIGFGNQRDTLDAVEVFGDR